MDSEVRSCGTCERLVLVFMTCRFLLDEIWSFRHQNGIKRENAFGKRGFSLARGPAAHAHANNQREQALVIRILPRKTAAATFEFLGRPSRERLLKAIGQAELARLLNDMAPDDRTGLLDERPAEVTKQLLAVLSPEERHLALSLLGYPRGTVDRLMSPHYVAIKEDWTVQQVFDHVRQHGEDSETLDVLYVIDGSGVLIDEEVPG